MEAQSTDTGGGTCLVLALPTSVDAAESTAADAVAGETAVDAAAGNTAAPGSTAVGSESSVSTAHEPVVRSCWTWRTDRWHWRRKGWVLLGYRCRSRWRSAASLPRLHRGCQVAACQSLQPVDQMKFYL